MAKRRSSVEWAQWTHEQNQEMLNSLKMEAIASPGGSRTKERDETSAGGSEDKMSKLLSRKNRTPGGLSSPVLPSKGHHPAAEAQRFVEDGTPAVPHDHSMHISEETSYLEAEIAQLKDEKALLLEDQSKLMLMIQTDNAKMMEVLNEVKASKQKMMDKIDTLEKERLKLKAFSAEVIENNIESILGSMPLSMLVNKRDGSDSKDPAEELHTKLVELVSQIRANQAEVLQRALSKVELAEKHFIADRMSDVNLILDELGRIASANPNNLQAADSLIASIPKALLDVVTGRLNDFQKAQNNVNTPKPSKKKTTVSGDAKIDSALDMIESALAGGSSSTAGGDTGWLSGSGTDAKSLMTQNNVLKAGMILLRKKNAEMRAQIASLSTKRGRNIRSSSRADRDPSSSMSPDGRNVTYKSSGNTTNDDSDYDGNSGAEQSDGNDNVAVPISGENKREQREKNRRLKEAKARRMFNSLPSEQQEYIWNILVSRVAEVTENHPLAQSVSLHLKQETVLEVALQVRELMASILVLPMSELNVGRGGSNSQLPAISLDSLYALVTRALSSTPVAMEIQVHTNMIMAYLFTRFGDTGDGIESEASTYSLPVPDYPVAHLDDTTNGGQSLKEYTEKKGNESYEDDKASSASSHSSRGGNEDYFNYSGGGPVEYMNNNVQTLQSSKTKRGPPPVSRPNYMGGTTANKSKRFSTIVPSNTYNSPGDKVAVTRGHKMTSSQQHGGGKDGNDFKYYAYRKTSILSKELPPAPNMHGR